MQVEVPMTLTTSPRRMLAPMASQWASNAPTGMGMPAERPRLRGPLGVRGGRRSCRRWRSGRRSCRGRRRAAGRCWRGTLPAAGRPSAGSTSTCGPWRRCCGGFRVGSVMPQSVAATMSQCSSAVTNFGAQFGVVAEPVQQLRPAPLGGVDAAAPVDAFEAGAAVAGVGGGGDLGGFAGGAVVAPEVVVAERD